MTVNVTVGPRGIEFELPDCGANDESISPWREREFLPLTSEETEAQLRKAGLGKLLDEDDAPVCKGIGVVCDSCRGEIVPCATETDLPTEWYSRIEGRTSTDYCLDCFRRIDHIPGDMLLLVNPETYCTLLRTNGGCA